MPDLVIDYSLLHQLATNARALRENLDIALPRGGGSSTPSAAAANRGAGYLSGPSRADVLASNGPSEITRMTREAVGNSGLFGQLTTFYTAWDRPFHDAMDRLKELADLLDGVATKFFDVDADFAGRANHLMLGLKTSQWEAKKAAYERYEKMRGEYVTRQIYDEHGNLITEKIPLVDPNAPAPEKPGDAPTSSSQNGAEGSKTVNSDGTTNTETTTVKGPGGLEYTETTTYRYGADTDGDGKPNVVGTSTTVVHSDGTNETITRDNNADGTYTIVNTTAEGSSTTTVTPNSTGGGYTSVSVDEKGETTTVDVVDNPDGTPDTKTVNGPDSVEVFTGDSSSDSWKSVSEKPVHQPDVADDGGPRDRPGDSRSGAGQPKA